MKAGQVYREATLKNGKKVLLRSLKWDDIDNILRFINELVEERNADPDFGLIHNRQLTREQEVEWVAKRLVDIENGNVVDIVAEYNGMIMGHADVTHGSLSDIEHRGLFGLSVAKEWRDIGVGAELINETIKQCKKLGMTVIELEVLKVNKRAIHLYTKMGFREIGSVPKGVYRNGRYYDELIMAVEL
ncbi:MAG: GNAT family N-acetyltransferase [Conexivisphaerales archaeon]